MRCSGKLNQVTAKKDQVTRNHGSGAPPQHLCCFRWNTANNGGKTDQVGMLLYVTDANAEHTGNRVQVQIATEGLHYAKKRVLAIA